MKDIEFIKWLVGYADGFEWYEDPEGELVTFGTGFTLDPKDTILFSGETLYPLLLHRTVIGINKGTDYSIALYHSHIALFRYDDVSKDKTFEVSKDTDYEKGIENVLKYIYEQEKNNEL